MLVCALTLYYNETRISGRCENDRFRSIHRHLRFPKEEDVAKLCCLCLLNGNRLSQHGNTSQYEFIWNPRSASLRIICGSTLRRLQAQCLNAYSTLPCPPLPRFAAEIGVCHRAHPRSAAALTIESLPPLNHEKRRHGYPIARRASGTSPPS